MPTCPSRLLGYVGKLGSCSSRHRYPSGVAVLRHKKGDRRSRRFVVGWVALQAGVVRAPFFDHSDDDWSSSSSAVFPFQPQSSVRHPIPGSRLRIPSALQPLWISLLSMKMASFAFAHVVGSSGRSLPLELAG